MDRNKWIKTVGFLAIFEIIGLIILFFSGLLPYNFRHQVATVSQQPKPEALPTIVKQVSFPQLGNVIVKSDDSDASKFWLISRDNSRVMLLDQKLKTVTDYTDKILALHDSTVTDIARVGKELFIGFQGGLLRYDESSGKHTLYTKQNGLSDNANIRVTVDPADSDTLWIGTFNGLNKFSISNGTFRSYSSEMNIPGTGLQPVVFHVDDRYVWVAVSAHGYTTGGVSRLDKKTGAWKAWGTESFAQGRTPFRFDSDGAAADGNEVIVQDDGIIYHYDVTRDLWQPITKYNQKSYKTSLALRGTTAYYNKVVSGENRASQLKALDILTGEESNLLNSTEERDLMAHIGKDNYESTMIEYNPLFGRLLLFSRNLIPGAGMALVNFSQDNVYQFLPYDTLKDFPTVFNVNLLAANNDHIIMTDANSVIDYNISTQTSRRILSHSARRAKIINDQLIVLDFPTCEMICDREADATLTVWSLSSGKIQHEASTVVTSLYAYNFGDSLDDLYIFTDSDLTSKKGFKFDPDQNTFEPVNAQTLPKGIEPQPYYGGTALADTSPDSLYSFSTDRAQKGKSIQIKVTSLNESENFNVAIGPERYNYFSPDDSIHLDNYQFDTINLDILWLGTDRGLIEFNLKTHKSQLYTTELGLISDKIQALVVTPDLRVIQHPNGVYVYKQMVK